MTESYQLKSSTLGTRVRFFNNFLPEDTDGAVKGYLLRDATGNPFKIIEASSEVEFSRGKNNIFYKTATYDYSTGMTYLQEVRSVLSPSRKERARTEYVDANFKLNGKDDRSWVEFVDGPIDDIYTDIKMVRSYDMLDTLNIHHTLEGEMPVQESPTGVLYGKLTSIQKITLENGSKLEIPLANVTVGIFVPTEEFPNPTAADEEGNRISLHLQDNSKRENYFNDDSFNFDKQFLRSTSRLMTIPDKYKYTATTNENGEFMLFDIPVGEQIFMLEIDLLKQGLTKDEVALNQFAYPADDFPLRDTVPHFVFKQFPVNIVPSYGDFQTGYTELNIRMPLDLRKWVTYYTFPVSAFGKSVAQLKQLGFNQPLTIHVRNMAREGFPNLNPVEMVEVEDIFKKNDTQQFEWENEFKIHRTKLEFRDTEYFAFKLPANIYYAGGGPNKEKALWLAGYQFKINLTSTEIWRTSGYQLDYLPNKLLHRSHYNLNRRMVTEDNSETSLYNPSQNIAVFPYERQWSAFYPERFKIPKKPEVVNFNMKYGEGAKTPPFLDGDMTFGYGRQIIEGSVVASTFSQRVSNAYLMKYEDAVSWNEKYSNGYEAIIDQNKISRVLNGETFQRLEAGYGYWMRPDGWPDVVNEASGDYQGTDTSSIKRVEGEFITLALDGAGIQKGGLSFYKVLEPNDRNEPKPPFKEKYGNLHIEATYRQRGRTEGERESEIQIDLTDRNDQDKMMTFGFDSGHGHKFKEFKLVIINKGSVEVEFGGKMYQPGDVLGAPDGIDGNSTYTILLKANAGFDVDDNSYSRCEYGVSFRGINNSKDSHVNDTYVSDFSVPSASPQGVPTYNLISYYGNMRTNYNSKKEKCKDFKDFGRGDLNYNHRVRVNGIIFVDSHGTSFQKGIWSTEGISVTCDNDNAIPYEVL